MPALLGVAPGAGLLRVLRAECAPHGRDKRVGQYERPVPQIVFRIELRAAVGQRERDEDAPGVVVEVDHIAPFDVRPVPASRRERRIAAVQQPAAEIEVIEQLLPDSAGLFRNAVLRRNAEEQRGFEIAVGPALFKHIAFRLPAPRRELIQHLFQRRTLRNAQPFGDPPAAVGRVHDAGAFEPLEIPSCRFGDSGILFHRILSPECC